MSARSTNPFFNGRVVVAAAATVFAMIAGAATTEAGLIQVVVEGNDCVGVFSGVEPGFENCSILPNDSDDPLSPIIIKFDADDDGNVTGVEVDGMGNEAINPLYDSVIGDEWSFMGGGLSGQFMYNPGEGDPSIKYWAAKAGNEFNLQFFVPDGQEGMCVDPLSVSCLSLAEAIPTGVWIDWNTGFPQNVLSHLSFYDSEGPDITETVEPATLSFLGLGLLALSRVRNRSRKGRRRI